GRLAHHLEVALGVQDHAEPRPHERLVVDDQDADVVPFAHEVPPMGIRALTTKPPPLRGPLSSVPPTTAIRSFMPTSPWPPPDCPLTSPWPSFSTWSSSWSGAQRTATHARAGPAYLRAFVSASWTTR